MAFTPNARPSALLGPNIPRTIHAAGSVRPGALQAEGHFHVSPAAPDFLLSCHPAAHFLPAAMLLALKSRQCIFPASIKTQVWRPPRQLHLARSPSSSNLYGESRKGIKPLALPINRCVTRAEKFTFSWPPFLIHEMRWGWSGNFLKSFPGRFHFPSFPIGSGCHLNTSPDDTQRGRDWE